jgi:DegV family protein with EDD domain
VSSYVIITDTGASLRAEYLQKYNIRIVPITCVMKGEQYTTDQTNEEEIIKIFGEIRDKVVVSTASVSDLECRSVFEKELKYGNDILYLGLSSGLSSSYATASRILEELKTEFPDRKIFHIDTLSAAMGEGRLVLESAKLREDGKSIDEVYAWLQDNLMKNCHLFTVESLSYLFRGGRVKRTQFILGTMLQIKPVMHVSDTGHLEPIGKAFGRRKSLEELAERVAKTIINPEEQTVYINHGDCLKDAEYLAQEIAKRVKVGGFDYSLLNVVIGAHSGPGTIAVFFAGVKR